MTRTYLDPPCPIAALATPPGFSALAIIRCSGPGSIELASRCFSRPARLLGSPGYGLVHGILIDPITGQPIDEVMAAIFRAPRSHTGEDGIEFTCHGSPEVIRRALACLESAGFAPALPGEFTLRALMNGKTDLLRAEAVEELVHSRGEAARSEALARLSGQLSARVGACRQRLVEILAEVEALLDHEEDELPHAGDSLWQRSADLARELSGLASTFSTGRLHQDGALTVIAGKPNAGKSSLFNLLLREERALVSDNPGTTRDWIESWIEVEGLALRLVDTAGLRDAESALESAGIERSRALATRADLVLFLVDGRCGTDESDLAFLDAHPRSIRLWNKIDLAGCPLPPPGWIGISASTAAGLDALTRTIAHRLGASASEGTEQAISIASERQRRLLDRSAASLTQILDRLSGSQSPELDLVALDLREAAGHLGEMTGEILHEEILDTIFSRFCLGK